MDLSHHSKPSTNSSLYSEQQHSYDEHKLPEDRYEVLNELFDALDQGSTGFLDIKDMQVLGFVLTGVMPSVQDTKEQIKRADFDHDDKISREEWHSFSLELAKMNKLDFESVFQDLVTKAHLYKATHKADEEDDE